MFFSGNVSITAAVDQPYKVRDKSWARLRKAILGLPLIKNRSVNYNHADAQMPIKRIDCELERQHNKFTTNGMKGLTSDESTNKLYAF